jgi:hypothetical protein
MKTILSASICMLLLASGVRAQNRDNADIDCNLNNLTDIQDSADLHLRNIFSGNPSAELVTMGPNPTHLPNAHLENVTFRRLLGNSRSLSRNYVALNGVAAAGAKPSGWTAKEEVEIRYYPVTPRGVDDGIVLMIDQDGMTAGQCHYKVKN